MAKQIKAGDKVISLITEIDVVKGNSYQVLESYSGGLVKVADGVGDPYILTAAEFKLAPAFKVGDRVRIVKKYVDDSGFYWNDADMTPLIGRVGEVESSPDLYGAYRVRTNEPFPDYWNYLPESLELVTEDTEEEAPKPVKVLPKVGDKVRCLRSYLDVTAGAIYTVDDVLISDAVHISDDVGDGWSLYPEDYELVTEDSAEEAPEPTKVLPQEGDRVKCLRTHVDVTEGRIYRVDNVGAEGQVSISDDDKGQNWFLYQEDYELVTEYQPAPQPAAQFLIQGYTTPHDSIEAAEEFAKEYGTNGQEFVITQIVRRVKLARTVSVSLEAA